MKKIDVFGLKRHHTNIMRDGIINGIGAFLKPILAEALNERVD